MIPWWLLVLCIVGAFSFGVLIMAMLQFSSIRDGVAARGMRDFERDLDLNGVHPLDSPSQA